MRPESQLSTLYHTIKAILIGGWQGEYGQLAAIAGIHGRCSARIAGRLVKSFALRYPSWPHGNVVAKRTGRPAYEG
jgi:alkylated DNA nucleotide flippase Atl1